MRNLLILITLFLTFTVSVQSTEQTNEKKMKTTLDETINNEKKIICCFTTLPKETFKQVSFFYSNQTFKSFGSRRSFVSTSKSVTRLYKRASDFPNEA